MKLTIRLMFSSDNALRGASFSDPLDGVVYAWHGRELMGCKSPVREHGRSRAALWRVAVDRHVGLAPPRRITLKRAVAFAIILSTMPTVLEDGPYRFVFFSSDKGEPPHIHVKRERLIAKFWLDPVALAKNRGFQGHELNHIARLAAKHASALLEAWNEYFSS